MHQFGFYTVPIVVSSTAKAKPSCYLQIKPGSFHEILVVGVGETAWPTASTSFKLESSKVTYQGRIKDGLRANCLGNSMKLASTNWLYTASI